MNKPETIRVKNELTGDTTELLERLEPWRAEQVLGLRVPMSSEMKQEFEYRKQQIEALANSMYKAPFSPRDA